MTDSDYEIVHTVTDYWDGARTGIADFKGHPHYYERPFDEAKDDWSSFFLLKPIDDETFRLAMEDWDIWRRWGTAYHEGKTTMESHPSLPEERARHEQLSSLLAQRLVVNHETDVRAKGEFEVREPKRANEWIAKLKVKWTVIS